MSSQLTQQQQDDLDSAFGNLKARYALIEVEVRQIQDSLGNAADNETRTRHRNRLVENSKCPQNITDFFDSYYIFAGLALTTHSRDVAAYDCFAHDDRFSAGTLFIEKPFTDIAQNNNPLQASESLSKLLKPYLKPERQQQQTIRISSRKVNNQDRVSAIIDCLNINPDIWTSALSERNTFWQALRNGPFPPSFQHCGKTGAEVFRDNRWYELMDRVTFAFRAVHGNGKESPALTAFREYAQKHQNMNGGKFAEKMTPTDITYDPQSLRLSKKNPSARMDWSQIHQALLSLVKQNGEQTTCPHVIVAVFGKQRLEQGWLTRARNTLYKNIQARKGKLRLWFGCPEEPSSPGCSKCTLGWVPGAEELVEAAERHLTHQHAKPGTREINQDSDGNQHSRITAIDEKKLPNISCYYSPCKQFVAELFWQDSGCTVYISARDKKNTDIRRLADEQIHLSGMSASLKLKNGEAVAFFDISELSVKTNAVDGKFQVGQEVWEPERESEV